MIPLVAIAAANVVASLKKETKPFTLRVNSISEIK